MPWKEGPNDRAPFPSKGGHGEIPLPASTLPRFGHLLDAEVPMQPSQDVGAEAVNVRWCATSKLFWLIHQLWKDSQAAKRHVVPH